MDAIGSFVAKKAFESKVDSLSKNFTSSLGLGGDEEGGGGSGSSAGEVEKRTRQSREAREAEERQLREREEAHKKRKENNLAKANALREKYGLPTDAPQSGSRRDAASTTPYKGSSSPNGFSSMSQCCLLS
jgi:hypothetical protein